MPAAGGLSIIVWIAVYAGMFAVLWYFIVRPQKKREQALVNMQNSIKTGDYIVTNGGLYGKVIDAMEEVVVVEVGIDKTVKIVLDRRGIHGVKTPNLQVKKESSADK